MWICFRRKPTEDTLEGQFKGLSRLPELGCSYYAEMMGDACDSLQATFQELEEMALTA